MRSIMLPVFIGIPTSQESGLTQSLGDTISSDWIPAAQQAPLRAAEGYKVLSTCRFAIAVVPILIYAMHSLQTMPSPSCPNNFRKAVN